MKQFCRCLAVLTLFLMGVGRGEAGYSLVTSRVALAGTDSVDWGQLGPTFTTVSNPFPATSTGGVTLTGSQALATSFERRDQDNGWGGNFSPGEKLLWTAGSNGPITLDFGSALLDRGGAQIQADFYGDFTAKIEALDSGGNVLASFTEDGTSNSNADGSAIFIGIRSDSANISQIRLGITSSAGSFADQDLAIDQFDFSSTAAAVPEPASLAMLGIGAVSLLGYGWRRRKTAAAAA